MVERENDMRTVSHFFNVEYATAYIGYARRSDGDSGEVYASKVSQKHNGSTRCRDGSMQSYERAR